MSQNWDWRNFKTDEEYRIALRNRDDLSYWGKVNQAYKDRDDGYRTQAEQQRDAYADNYLRQNYTTAPSKLSASTWQKAYDAYEQDQLSTLVNLRSQGVGSGEINKYVDTAAMSSLLAKYRQTAKPDKGDYLFLATTNFSKDPRDGVYSYDDSDPEDRIYKQMGLPSKSYLEKYKTGGAIDELMAQAGLAGIDQVRGRKKEDLSSVYLSDAERLRAGLAPNSILEETAKLNAYKTWYMGKLAEHAKDGGTGNLDLENNGQFLQERAELFPEYAQAREKAFSTGSTSGYSVETNDAPKDYSVGSFSGKYTPGETEAKWLQEYRSRTQPRVRRNAYGDIVDVYAPAVEMGPTREEIERSKQARQTADKQQEESGEQALLGKQNEKSTPEPYNQENGYSMMGELGGTPMSRQGDAEQLAAHEELMPVSAVRQFYERAYGADGQLVSGAHGLIEKGRGFYADVVGIDPDANELTKYMTGTLGTSSGKKKSFDELTPGELATVYADYYTAVQDYGTRQGIDKVAGEISRFLLSLMEGVEDGRQSFIRSTGRAANDLTAFLFGKNEEGVSNEALTGSIYKYLEGKAESRAGNEQDDGTIGEFVQGAMATLTNVVINMAVGKALPGGGKAASPAQSLARSSGQADDIVRASTMGKALLSRGGNATLKTLPFNITSYGSYANQAKADGASVEQQMQYGLLGALVEGSTERLIPDFIQGFGGKVAQKMMGKALTQTGLRKAVSMFGTGALTALFAAVPEGLEEMASEVGATYAKRLTYDPDAKVSADDVLQSGLYGALMGMVFGGTGFVSEARSYQQAVDIIRETATTGVLDVEKVRALGRTMEADMEAMGEAAIDQDAQATFPDEATGLGMYRTALVQEAGELRAELRDAALDGERRVAIQERLNAVTETLSEMGDGPVYVRDATPEELADTDLQNQRSAQKINLARQISEIEQTREFALRAGSQATELRPLFNQLAAIEDRLADPKLFWGDAVKLRTQQHKIEQRIRQYNDQRLPDRADQWVANAFLKRDQLGERLKVEQDPIKRGQLQQALQNLDKSIEAVEAAATDPNYLLELHHKIVDLKKEHARVDTMGAEALAANQPALTYYTNLAEAKNPNSGRNLEDAYSEFILQSKDRRFSPERKRVVEFSQKMIYAREDIGALQSEAQALWDQYHRQLPSLIDHSMADTEFQRFYNVAQKAQAKESRAAQLRKEYVRDMELEASRRYQAMQDLDFSRQTNAARQSNAQVDATGTSQTQQTATPGGQQTQSAAAPITNAADTVAISPQSAAAQTDVQNAGAVELVTADSAPLSELHEKYTATQKEHDGIWASLKDSIQRVLKGPGDALAGVRYQWFDDADPIRSYTQAAHQAGVDLGAAKDPYMAAFVSGKHAGERASNIIMGELRHPLTAERLGPSLVDVMTQNYVSGDHMKEYQARNEYLNLRRDMDWYAQGLTPSGSDVGEGGTRRLIADYEQQYPGIDQWADQVNQWWQTFTRAYAVDTGLWSQQQYDELAAKYPHYVPNLRVMDDGKQRTRKGKGLSEVDSGLQKAKGSTRSTYTAAENYAAKITEIVELAGRQRIALNIHDTYQQAVAAGRQDALSGFLMEIPARNAGKYDLTARGGEDGTQTIFFPIQETQQGKRPKRQAQDEFAVRDADGQMHYYQLKDDLFKRAVLDFADPWQGNAAVKAVGALNRLEKTLMTGSNPIFAVKNAIRDMQDFTVYGAVSNPGEALLKEAAAFGRGVKADPLRDIYRSLGLEGETYSTTDNVHIPGKNDLYRNLRNEAAKRSGKNKVGGYLTEHLGLGLIDGINAFNNLIEQAPRYAEFKSVIAKEMGISTREAGQLQSVPADVLQKAAYSAMEVTQNFSRAGAMSRKVNQFVYFWSAGMGGLYKPFGGMKNPTEVNAKKVAKQFGGVIAKSALWLTAANVLADGLCRMFDKENYEELPDYIRKNYYCIPSGEPGRFLRLPKSKALLTTLFTQPVQYAMDAAAGEHVDVGEAFATLTEGILPGMSSAVNPIFEVGSNTSWYGTPIVPDYLLDLEPSRQYDDTTSGIGKALGGLLNRSPKKIDYLINQYGGWVGDILLPYSTSGTAGVKEMISRQFMADSAYSNQSKLDYSALKRRLDEDIATVSAERTSSRWRANTPEEQTALLAALKAARKNARTWDEPIDQLYAEIDKVEQDQNLSDDERYDVERALRLQINALSAENLQRLEAQMETYLEKYRR